MPQSCPVEPFSPEFLVDPHPSYQYLRRHEPVRQVVLPSGERAWLVTRYEDVRRGLSDPRLSSDQTKISVTRAYSAMPEVQAAITTDMLSSDPPVHSRLRKAVSEVFTASKAEEFRPRLEAICDDLLDKLATADTIDVVADFAAPFVSQALAELLGISSADGERIRLWRQGIITTFFQRRDDPLLRPTVSLHDHTLDLIADKRAKPADDLLTRLIASHDEGGLSADELTSMVFLLLIAGTEGPTNSIGTGVHLLLTHPGELAKIQANPGLLPSAIDEFIRYEPPLGLGMYRSAAEPVTFSGVTIPAREPILFSLLSTGHDETRFQCPEQLDVGRNDRRHLGFGWGLHHCLGAPLGRLECEVAIGRLLARYGELELAVPAEEIEWLPSVITRGLAALPVRLRPPGS